MVLSCGIITQRSKINAKLSSGTIISSTTTATDTADGYILLSTKIGQPSKRRRLHMLVVAFWMWVAVPVGMPFTFEKGFGCDGH